MKIREMQLERIKEALTIVLADLQRTTGPCPVCGAFRADDSQKKLDVMLLSEMRKRIVVLQERPWAQEER